MLLIDEIDTLSSDTLESILTQLRDGYIARPLSFPQSVVLCGVRNLMNYRFETSKGTATGSGCFNVEAKSLRLGNFCEDDVRELYNQHTAETGQRFEEPVFPAVMRLSGGQPWLVNALARELTEETPTLLDRSQDIDLDALNNAKEQLIKRRNSHITQLPERLKEDSVRRVIAAIVNGDAPGSTASAEDRQYVADLGLIVIDDDGVRIANEIYQEVIPRTISHNMEADLALVLPRSSYIHPDGRLDFRAMLAGFQQFYRKNSDAWSDRTMYPEIAPHILLQTWLHRVVNSGGQITREHALGTKRSDIFVRYPFMQGGLRKEQRFVLEVKVARTGSSVQAVINEGLPQTAMYADKCAPDEAHLVVFDAHEGRNWDEKVYVREENYGGRGITVWGV